MDGLRFANIFPGNIPLPLRTAMSRHAELHTELRRYLAGGDAVALEDWVVAHLQPILDSGDAAALRLADELDVSLVELGEGIIDPAAFRERLARLD